MDIISHGLWAVVAGKTVERKIKTPLGGWKLFASGVLPDALAFGIPFIWLIWNAATGDVSFADGRPQDGEPPALASNPIYRIPQIVYPLTHSLVICAVTVLLVWLARSGWKRLDLAKLPWLMIGWPLHILCDVPTHSYRFYPTPVLWPLSGWKFDGFSWGQPWFMALNYSLLLIAFLALRLSSRRKPEPSPDPLA